MDRDRADGDRRVPELFTKAEWAALAERFGLSPRQAQIARLICLAFSNLRIARELGLKRDTVRMHNKELFRKLGIRQRMGVPIRLVLACRKLAGRRSGE